MTQAQPTPDDIDQYLKQHQDKELLRFVTVGSVDDGKSTLIGRLLHDTQGVYEDQLSAVKKASTMGDMEIDFSLFTDGLKAEREQGITIDVAYRYFSTDKRKFIIADTPGHVQYTRNMATGASTANVGIILIDARLGVLQQSRRHSYIGSLIGIPHLLVAVNKMDLKNYDEKTFNEICEEFRAFARGLNFKDVKFVPISAKLGDNVVHKSDQMPWYDGGTLLEYLEDVPIATDRNLKDFRFPVQYVLRPDLNYRGFAGEVASGSVKKGDPIIVLPSKKTSTVAAIDTFDGEVEEAFAPQAVTIRLSEEIDVSRGDMLVHPSNLPSISQRFETDVVWMSEQELDSEKSYLLKHTTQVVRVNVEAVQSVLDLETLKEESAASLGLNDIGKLRLVAHKPIHFDPYGRSKATGAFILIDSITNNTVAAGMIRNATTGSSGFAGEGQRAGSPEAGQVSSRERLERLGQVGACVLVTGGGAARTAYAIERALYDQGRVATVIAADDASAKALGRAPQGVVDQCVRLAEVGVISIVALPLANADAEALRTLLGTSMVEVKIGATLTVNGEALRLGKRAVSSHDLESQGRAVVAHLAERKLFLEDSR